MANKKTIYIFITLWLVVTFNSQWSSARIPIVGLGVIVLLEGILLLLNINSLSGRLNAYKKWVFILLVFWGLSTTWSVNPHAFESYWKYSLPYVIAFVLSPIITTKSDVEKFLKINILAAVLCGLYVLLFVNTGSLSEVRFGSDADGTETIWNSNDIGIKMSMGYAFSVYFLLKGEGNRLLLSALTLFFFALSFLSGSRSVALLIVAFTALLLLARSKGRKKVLYLIIAVVFVIAAYWAVMNVPMLYDILGRRFEKMEAGLTGGEGGFSMDMRSLMIASGLGWFLEEPILGNGFDGFSILFGKLTGIIVYSHSNIIEMLVNSGIVGFCIYYSLTVYIIIKLWKPALHDKEPLALVLFVYTFIAALSDYVVVAYVNTPYIIRLMYTAMYCHIIGNKQTIPQVRTKVNRNEASLCNQ